MMSAPIGFPYWPRHFGDFDRVFVSFGIVWNYQKIGIDLESKQIHALSWIVVHVMSSVTISSANSCSHWIRSFYSSPGPQPIAVETICCAKLIARTQPPEVLSETIDALTFQPGREIRIIRKPPQIPWLRQFRHWNDVYTTLGVYPPFSDTTMVWNKIALNNLKTCTAWSHLKSLGQWHMVLDCRTGKS